MVIFSSHDGSPVQFFIHVDKTTFTIFKSRLLYWNNKQCFSENIQQFFHVSKYFEKKIKYTLSFFKLRRTNLSAHDNTRTFTIKSESNPIWTIQNPPIFWISRYNYSRRHSWLTLRSLSLLMWREFWGRCKRYIISTCVLSPAAPLECTQSDTAAFLARPSNMLFTQQKPAYLRVLLLCAGM